MSDSSSNHIANSVERFTKSNDELIGLGLPPRLVLLYGTLVYHAGADGKCFPKHETLAKEIGLRSRWRRRQVINLVSQLEALKLVKSTRRRGPSAYEILRPNVKWISHLVEKGISHLDVKRSSHRKESSSKESLKRKTPRPKSPRKPEGSLREPAGKTKAQESQKFDDEKTKPRPQANSPEAEFRARLIERHGATFDADRCAQNVRRQLEKAGGLSMTDFLARDAERTTAPGALKNPNGYYTQMAKELRHATIAATLTIVIDPLRTAAAAPSAPEPERDKHGRCMACGGVGKLADGAFCTCPMGRDLEGLERRAKVQAEKKGPETEAKVSVATTEIRNSTVSTT